VRGFVVMRVVASLPSRMRAENPFAASVRRAANRVL
jgi:hypothetical protein